MATKKKYSCIRINDVITSIGYITKLTYGEYSESIINGNIPNNCDGWSITKCKNWIKSNNKRMEAICKLLNDKNL